MKYPRYDEIIGLTPELTESGNSLLRTQTLWSAGSEGMILQAEKIDGHQVGVRYMYYEDFNKLSIFPDAYSFGKRVIIIPPGAHVIEIYYSGKASYLLNSMNQEHSRMVSYNATIPADSICVLLPAFDSYKVDMYKPTIRLECRKKQTFE